MKRTIIRTALVSLVAAIILLITVFGVMSLAAPTVMMRFTASMGMKGASGDYAYQQYQRSGDLEYLVRSFVTAAEKGRDKKAEERFSKLYGEENSEERTAFTAFCTTHTVDAVKDENNNEVMAVSYRSYLCSLAARVKYRLSKGKAEDVKERACDFAISETSAFTSESPAVSLALVAVDNKDADFCKLYLEKLKAAGYESGKTYEKIIDILENCK